MILFSPSLPWPLIAALGSAAAAALLPGFLTGARGAVCRLGVFALLLAMLAGPDYVALAHRPLPDILTVAIDRSASMAIGDRAGLAARALQSLQTQAARRPGLELRMVDIPPAGDGGTAVFGPLREAMAGIPPAQRAGIVLITDGEISDPPATNDLGAPLTTLLAADGEETDRELRLNAAPDYGLVGQNVALRFTVIDHGAPAGALVPVTISADGAPIRSVIVAAGTPVTVGLMVRHAGPAVISLQAAPLPGEVSAGNDQAAFTLTGIRKRLRVLLVSGNPDQGERSWRVLLKSDPAVQLVHFTILRTPDELLDAPASELALVPFPVEQLFVTNLDEFDLIILDQFDATGLLPPQYLANIAAHVRQGGALLVEVGPEFAGGDSLAFTPLGPLLPAVPTAPGTLVQPFAPRLTAIGARHPVTAPFAGAPLAPWYRQEIATPTGGEVLLSGIGNAPLLILSGAGAGRVALLLSDQFWLWTRGGGFAGPALPLLRRCVHWLLNEPALQAEALTARLDAGRLAISRQTLGASYPGDATVTAPDGGQTRLRLHPSAPGIFEAGAPAGQPGLWRIAEGGLTAEAAQEPANPQEYRNLAATAAILRPLSANIIWLGRTPSPALSQMLQPRHASIVTGRRDVPLLPPLPTMIAAIALLAGAWWREQGRGKGFFL